MCATSHIFVLCLVLLCYSVVNINSFNLDTVDYVRHSGEEHSMFGFSVATHKDRSYNWVIVGAPEAQSTQQSGVFRGGAVFKCPADRDEDCREMPFDRTGNNVNSAGLQIDEKSRQWFGATVNSGGPDKPIVACAPRYIWYTTTNKRRDPVGTCFVSNSDFSGYSEFSPCRTRHWGYHRQGTCQAGLGAAMSKDGQRLFIGAPGSWYWQGQTYSVDPKVKFPYVPYPSNGTFGDGAGQMYSIDPEVRLPFTPPRFSNYGTGGGQVYSQHLKDRPSVFFTKEGNPIDDDSYMGYSVTAGNFTGEKDGGIAVGMPRGSRLMGKVVLYTWNLTNHQNITGRQLGEYFGYAVAAADMNGDGLDELIVGAPLHTEPNNEGKYEVGRVYILSPLHIKDDPEATPDTKWPRMRIFHTRDGVNSKGRFGLSLANLGDLDLDGYQDIAIGAPYDGPLERGAVYIYYGSKKGIHEKASQIIYAEDVSQTSMYTFGFSLAGAGIDLDNNQYPDLVVGAYLSNSAFVFRSRPVINVEASVLFSTRNKVISLDERNCSLTRDRSVSCTSLNACVKYDGIGVSDGIVLEVEFVLDSKNPKDPRMFLLPSERRHRFNETWTVRRNHMQCKSMQVYLRESTRDKLTPLEVEMRYSLPPDQRTALSHRRNPRSALNPVLNGNKPSVFKDSITIKKNCGPDDVCIPDLRLFIKPNVEKYLLGSGKRLVIDVIVKNEGEDSFESMFYMKMPPGINYFNTERVGSTQDISVKCSAPSESTNNTLKCDIGNPLPGNKLVHFKVLLDPFNMEGMNPSYDFFMKANSTNPEDAITRADNTKQLSIDIWVKTNLSLTGWAQSPDIHYKENQYREDNFTTESEIGPQVVHIYSIKNNGPSDINEAEVLFMWPDQTLGGDDLLYLMEQPELSGLIKCDFAEANALKVELLPKKYYLEPSDNKGTNKVRIEEKLTSVSNVGTSDTLHIQTDVTSKDKIDETGDASHVHVHRGKESKKVERTHQAGSTISGSSTGGSSFGGSGSGDSTFHKEERTYSWNASSVDGGPVHTWSRNTSSVTGNDGVTHFAETSSGGQGDTRSRDRNNINKYKIHYTSTGNNQGTNFGESSNEGQGGASYSISHQSNLGQYDFDETRRIGDERGYRRHGQSYATGNVDEQFGGQVSRPTDSGHTLFSWDDDRTTNVKESSQTQQQNSTGATTGSISRSGEMVYGSGGRISSSGEMVYHEEKSGSGTVQNGSHDIGSRYGTSATTYEDNSRIGETRGTAHHQISGSSGTAHHQTSGSSGTSHHQTSGSSGSSGSDYNQASASVSGSTSRHQSGSSQDRGTHYGTSSTTYEEKSRTDGSRGSAHHQTSGSDVHGSSSADWEAGGTGGSSGTHHQTSSSYDASRHGAATVSHATSGVGSVFHTFYTMSGHDLRGLIGEEDLRKMLATGSGEYHNGTHKIRWSTDGHGGTFRLQNDTYGLRRPYSISTEESVNQGLDEYTRTMTQGGSNYHQSGRDRSTYGQYDQSNYNAEAGLGAAAVGGGFRTTGVDLGVLSGSKADENTSGHNYGSYYDEDLGSYEDRTGEGQAHGSVSYGTSRTSSSGGRGSSGGSRHDSRHSNSGTDGQGGHYQSQHSSSHYSYNSGQSGSGHFAGDNVPTEHPTDLDYRNRIYRSKRQADDDISEIIECKSTKCSYIRCKAGPLVKDEEAFAALRFRANAATLKKIGWTQVVTVSSMMVSRINKLPYIGTPNDRPIHTHEVFTNVTLTETEIKPDVVPLWVVVLSACAGTIILLLLIFLLYKCGFFKRNRPSDAPERQPLNRNGHYQGDEQL